MAYTSLYDSLVSVPRGRGMVLAINGELLKLWNAVNGGVVAWGGAKALTISSGEVSFSIGYSHYQLDTEGAAATDSLTKFADVPEGRRIIVRSTSASRTITLTNGSFLKLQHDFTLANPYSNIVLVGAGSDVCFEESRSAVIV